MPPTRRLPLFALLTSTLVSTTGNAIALIAIPWYVLATTGSPAQTGVIAFFSTLAPVLGGFFGGAIVDRLGPWKVSVLADILSGATVAAIPILHSTVGLPPLWALVALVFLGGLFDTPGNTARSALLVDLAQLARWPLERATAANELVAGVPYLIGPPLGAALIAWLGSAEVLWLDAGSFAFSAAAVALLVPAMVISRNPSEVRTSYLSDLKEGVRFVTGDPLIRAMFSFTSLVGLLVVPLVYVVLPVYIRGTFGEATNLGWLIAGFILGSLLGLALFGTIGQRLPRRLLFIGGILGPGVAAVVLATLPSLLVMVGGMVVGGIIYGPFDALLETVVGERTPAELRGRVYGTLRTISTGTTPFGALLAGFGLQILGIRSVLTLLALCLVGLTIAAFANRSLRELSAHRLGRQPEPGFEQQTEQQAQTRV